MKTVLLVILFPAIALCQGFLPRWEMSLSADANSFSNRAGNTQYLSLAFRPGLFLDYGVSIEPELEYGRSNGLNAMDLSGNLSYSMGIGYWPVVPFVLVGYGFGDGLPFYQPMPQATGGSSDITFLNAGGGLKIMTLGGRALLRVEYRYQAFTANYTGFTDKIFGRRLLLGFSVLL